MEKEGRQRVIFIFVCFSVLFLVVIGKAFKVQVIDKENLLARSRSQIFREIKVYPKRGNIYDRNSHPLAINIQTYSIFTIPKNLKGNYRPYKKLSKIIPKLTYRNIRKKIHKRKRYTWLARKISLSQEQVKKIKKLEGIYIDSVPKRIYPNNEIASQILGFVGIDNVGLAGIEYKFDKRLRGNPKAVKYIKDAKGRPVKFENEEISAVKVSDITLSIDKDLQSISEKYIAEAVIKSKAVKGGVGVLDVKTGEILAMANYPTFDPNNVKGSKAENRRLSFATDPFEPGSTFKAFTIASALENKIATIDTNYFCEEGSLKVEDHIINEAESKKGFGWLSVEDILKFSSNIGTTKIAFDLTYPKLKKTLKKFSFGEKTGVEVPGESRGIFNNNENISPLSLSNISFGQGVATTGIQMLSAYGAIANGGYLLPPTLIKGGNKNLHKVKVLSKETTEQLEKMLIQTVENGTGSRGRINFFRIAGKTSTAQRADSNGGYTGYIPGFIGYPTNVKNRFVVYAYVDKPEGRYYGNEIAGPVFRKVTEYLLFKNKEFSRLAITSKSKVQKETSFDMVKVKHSSARIFGSKKVPDFIGLDKRSARRISEKVGFKLITNGMGVVKEQSPAPGSDYDKLKTVRLRFEPPTYE